MCRRAVAMSSVAMSSENPPDPRSSLRHAVTTGDGAAVGEIVSDHWMYLLESRSLTLQLALGMSLPAPADEVDHVVRSRLRAHYADPHRPLDERTDGRGEHSPASRSSTGALAALIARTIASITARAQGRTALAARHARAAERLLEEFPGMERQIPPELLCGMQLQWFRSHALTTPDVSMRDVGDALTTRALSAGRLDVVFGVAAVQALAHATSGRGRAADQARARAAEVETFLEPWQRRRLGVPLRLAATLRSLDHGRGDEAAVAAGEDREAERESDLWASALTLRAQLPRAKSDPLRFLAEVEAEADSHPSAVADQPANRVFVDLARAHMNALAGRVAVGVELLARCASIDESGVVPARLAALRHLMGSADASAVIERVLQDDGDRPRVATEMLVLKAARALTSGDGDAAGRLFRRAVGVALENDIPRSLVVAGEESLLLLAAHIGESDHLRAFTSIDDELSRLDHSAASARLTPRERAVLLALLAGKTRTEVARENFVSVETVRTQVRAVYRKLGVSSLEAAARAAAAAGLTE